MQFDLESAFAVRERDDGLLEKDTFDITSATPIPDGVDPSVMQQTLSHPGVQKLIDTFTGGITSEEANQFTIDIMEPLANIGPILTEGGIMPTPLKVGKGTVELAKFVLSAMGRPVAAAQAGIGAVVDKKPLADVVQSMVRGYVKPGEVKSLVSRVPFQEWEQGAWAKLIPRATAEAVETYLVSSLVYGNIPGKIKAAYDESKAAGAAQELNNITTKAAKDIVANPEKFKINFPKEWNKADKLGMTKAYLQNRLGSIPKVGDVLMERQSFMSKLKATLGSEVGAARIPKIGDAVDWKGQIAKITQIDGERVILALGKSEIVATLSQLTLAPAPKEAVLPTPGALGEAIIPKSEALPTGEGKVLDSLNPTGKVFTDYTPEMRATIPLGENITTLDKTSNKSPDEIITIYRGAGKGKEIVAGDFITTNKQLAKDYAGTGNVIEKKVKLSDILDDKTEPLGEEYIYRPTPTGQKPPVEPPKTVISPEPTPEEEFAKLHKEYVRATPIGKILTRAAEIKQELANEDFLIKAYESDISKLEEQLKIEQFNTEAEKLKAQDKLQALKDKYTLAKETQRQRKAYRDEVAGLVQGIEAAPKGNIATEYQDMIEQLKSKFDLKRRTEKTTAKRESMKAFVERMKVEGKPIEIPKDKLEMLEKVNLEDMTLDQLKEISSTIKNLETLGKTKLKAREAVYEATKEKAKSQLLKSSTPIKSKQLEKLPIGEKHSVWVKKAIDLQNAVQKTGVGLTPIDGLADVTGMGKMKEVLDKDFSKYLTHNDEAIDKWYKLTKDFTDKEFERIGVIAASRQEGGLERLANSGITEEEVKAIKLTPAEEKVYKFVIDTFDKEYPAVKQYSKEVYNADVGQQENYVSFMSDYEQMSDLEIYQKFGQTPEQIAVRKTKTVEQGFTKERAGVSKIKLETNIDKIFRRHLDDVAYMLNTGKNIKMYFEIVNSPEMREKLGDVGTLAWLQYLDLMARKGGAEGAKRIAALDILRKNIGAGVLSFRLSSALVQFSSFADTIATIGAEWATKGATAITNKEWRNFIMDNFPEIKKAIGDDIAFREFGEGALAKLANVGLKPLQFLDGIMRSTAAAGSYQKLAAEKGIAIDLKNPNADLILEATKLMRNSQGSSFFKDQPLAITAGYGLTDNRSVNKLLLTFQSFMLNRWDNINRQIWRMGIKEKDYGKAISSLFWLVIFAGAVEEGIRRGSRKITQAFAKDKRKEDSFIQGTLLNIIQSIPLVGQLTSSIVYSSNPVPVINTFDDLLEGIGAVVKGKAIETKTKGVVKTLGAAGSLYGLAGSSQVAQIIKDMIPRGKSKKKSL